MKSLDKFQYDSSPHTNEEVEELDEISLVGMVRAGGKAVKNVVQNVVKNTPKAIQSGSNAVQQGIQKINQADNQKRTKLNNVISNQSKKVERVQQRADKKIDNVAKNNTQSLVNNVEKRKKVIDRAKNIRNIRSDKARAETAAKDKQIDQNIRDLKSPDQKVRAAAKTRTDANPSMKEPRLATRIKRFGYKDPEKAKDLTRGGINSKLVRSVGSVAKAVGQGITGDTGANKISYNQKGDGYSGAFQGLGSNVKNVGKNVLKAPTFSSTKVDDDPKSPTYGKITKGDQVGTVADKLGATALRNRDKDNLSSKEKVTGAGDDIGDVADAKRQENKRKRALNQDKVTTGSGQDDGEKKPEQKGVKDSVKKQVTQGQGVGKPQNVTNNKIKRGVRTQLTDRTDDDLENTPSSGDENVFRRNASRNNTNQNQNKTGSYSDAVDKQGRPISRFGKRQPYVTYNNNKNKKKNGRVTGDGYPTGKDATHWLDAQKQHSSKTPKLFEQFLFEIDTKSTKKKKKDGRGMHPHDEIKPMSGTNTITINPEDETSKYKRGY